MTKLPWIISCAIATVLAIAQSHADNSYQTVVNEEAYGKTGDLQLVQAKSGSPIGAIVTISAVLAATYSLHKAVTAQEIAPTIAAAVSHTGTTETRPEQAKPSEVNSTIPQSGASIGRAKAGTWVPDMELDIYDRAKQVIRYLSQSDFPIGKLRNSPYVFACGDSQSGKSTILHLVSILELALGEAVFHTNPDSGCPPLKFTAANIGSMRDTVLLWLKLADFVSNAEDDSLIETSYWMDEMWRIASQTKNKSGISEVTSSIVETFLAKGNKTGARIRIASQNATQGANGLSKCYDAFKSAFVFVQALMSEPTDDKPAQALGKYEVVFKGEPEIWTVPDCLKTVQGRRGQPDPVASMLRWFPELKTENIPLWTPENVKPIAATAKESAANSDPWGK